jgi:hypothetical protein
MVTCHAVAGITLWSIISCQWREAVERTFARGLADDGHSIMIKDWAWRDRA